MQELFQSYCCTWFGQSEFVSNSSRDQRSIHTSSCSIFPETRIIPCYCFMKYFEKKIFFFALLFLKCSQHVAKYLLRGQKQLSGLWKDVQVNHCTQRWGLPNLAATNHRNHKTGVSVHLCFLLPGCIQKSDQTGTRSESREKKQKVLTQPHFPFQWGEITSSWSTANTVCRKKFKFQGDGQQYKITKITKKLIMSGLFECVFVNCI